MSLDGLYCTGVLVIGGAYRAFGIFATTYMQRSTQGKLHRGSVSAYTRTLT